MKAMVSRSGMLVKAHARGRPLPAGEAAVRVKTGLPVAELDALRDLLGVTMENLAARIGLSIATLSRRRHSGQRLDPGHRDRVLRLARLFRLATEPQAAHLPRSWRTSRGLLATQRIGDAWQASGRALALAVPRTIVPEEVNYVLNPVHPAYARLKFGRSIPFLLDPRLVG